MKNLPVALVLIFFISPSAHAAQRICYFSFNNQTEVETTKSFVNQINQIAPDPIEVKEFLTEGDDPEKSFLKMVKSGQKCDGLVITGHHTGAHGGKRANGKLSLEFIEKLSCDPQYAAWFRGVNALWLEGCRTMGVGIITPETRDKELFRADYHVKRVNSERHTDGLTQSVANLDHEFSTTLDQDNPLNSRYLRMFSKAKVFGWTNSAPGEKSKSEYSMLFHLAHISKYLDTTDGLPESPLNQVLSPKGLQQYLDAVNLSLMPFEYKDRSCEQIAVQGWIDHGSYSKENPFYAYENPDLKASSSLENSGNVPMLQVKAKECALKNAANAGDETKLLQVIDSINADVNNYRYTLNTMLSVYEELKKKKSRLAPIMLNRMRNNSQWDNFLQKKIESSQVGFIRKIDYLSIQRELTGNNNPQAERTLKNRLLGEIANTLPTEDRYQRSNAVLYRSALLQALIKGQMADEELYGEILEFDPEWDVLVNMIKNVSAVGLSPNRQKEMIVRVLKSAKADPVVWKAAVAQFQRLQVPEAEVQYIYSNISLVPEFQFDESGGDKANKGSVAPAPQAPFQIFPNSGPTPPLPLQPQPMQPKKPKSFWEIFDPSQYPTQ